MTTEPLTVSTVSALVTDAVAAPSLGNAQPWAFRYLRDAGVLRLYADLERALAHADPENRGLHLGCGAALLNLRVSAAASGLAPDVRLLPDPAHPELLAEVRLSGTGSPDDALAALHPAVPRRHSSRFPYRDEDIPADVRERLADAARAEGAQLVLPGVWHVQSILDLVRDAEGREASDPAWRAETERWTRMRPAAPDAAGPSDGIPAEAFGPRQQGSSVPVRDFAGGRPVPGRGRAVFEKNPKIALLGTAEDGPVDWLRAGQALERVLLRATTDGLVASLTSQPLEWSEIRWAVRDPLSAMAYVQMVLRLGYGPEGPASPRRPVADVLDVV
ncbi:Acg family FMN-binding oxidoreductase [Streptomyces murinus]|uniref:Acg family FMN-binding oxidoreductase n=1 Tax=Streptomyces murinus TaxID=33900 RepID=UPI003F44DC86